MQSELAELQLFPGTVPPAGPGALVARHRAVVDAIGNRDGALARRLTEEHIATRTLAMIEVHLALTAAGGEPSQQDSTASRTHGRRLARMTGRGR